MILIFVASLNENMKLAKKVQKQLTALDKKSEIINLVNFIAWVSRVGDDFRELFSMKKIQLATHSGGGGTDVSNAMRTQFTRLGSIVMPREIIATYQASLKEESLEKILKTFVSFISRS